MNRTRLLLEQIIELANVQSKELDQYNILRHKAMKTLGENAVVFHLNLLKELIDIEEAELKSLVKAEQ